MSAPRASTATRARRLAALALLVPTVAAAQIPGENVNMVSGTGWPGGDPFLQRQNEPSLAVSSANPLHLLAGANDYRTVDLPSVVVDKAAGDAWLGIFKSFDGGQTWQSTLLPGYPQDTSAEGLASPLRGLGAAADPAVRAGTDGLFYVSGIAFSRGTNLGKVFVTRFYDRNDKENGDATAGRDPIVHLGPPRIIDTGTAGQFMDKPWLAVDVPRDGAGTCTLPGGRTVPAGNVYFVYAIFTGSGSSSSKIMFTRSADCGATWAAPQKLSESNSLNQGTIAAVDPVTGWIHVAWRRFATSSQSDAIVYARSTDGGLTFTKGQVIASVSSLDQDTSPTMFRVESFPALAVSVSASSTPTSRLSPTCPVAQSWVHLAWSQRTASGDARIVMMTSADCGSSWSAPAVADGTSLADDAGNAFTRGHQLMPALTFSQGRLVLLYYDSRLDHTRGYLRPNQPFVPDPSGSFYTETRAPRGELAPDPLFGPANPAVVYTPFIDDAGLNEVRHTLDVRVAQAAPGASPSFTGARVSRYRIGTRGDEKPGDTVPAFGGGSLQVVDAQGNIQLLQELQSNPPNLPLFKAGTVPFMGDYIDVAGSAFVRTGGGGWAHDTALSSAPVFHAVWTSNQDVRPPPDGDWTRYTPVGGGGASLYDPTQTSPACVPGAGREGMRNQNIYTSRITYGLLVGSPQNVKPLSPTVTRAFVVAVTNTTDREVAVRFTASPAAGVDASFRNDGVVLRSFDVAIPARSSVYRSLFARLNGSSDPGATISVTAAEVVDDPACLGAVPPLCPVVTNGLSGFVTLNPPGVPPALTQPDGSATDISNVEVYAPTMGGASVSIPNATLSNATLSNATLTNATLSNATLSNATLTNAHLANAESSAVDATLSNATLTNATLSNATLSNATLTNATLTNSNLISGSISDATYQVTNTGNTTHSYHVVVVGSAPSTPLQLIVSRSYATPTSVQCQLVLEPHDVVVASVEDVRSAMVPPGGVIADPNIPDPRSTNATVALAPGESASITLRGLFDLSQMSQLTTQLAPAVVPHGGGGYAAPLLVSTDGAALGSARVGIAYQATLQAIGGTAPYVWSLASGSGPLPGGLSLSGAGAISGTPTAAGTFAFTVTVTDASGGAAIRALQLSVTAGPTSTTLAASPAAPIAGQTVTLTASVSAASGASGVPVPTGQVTFYDGETSLGAAALSSGAAKLATTALAAGAHVLLAVYGGDANFAPSTSAPSGLTVAPAFYQFTGFLTPLATAGTLASPSTSGTQRFGSAIPIKWQLRDAFGAVLNSLSTTRLMQAYLLGATCPAPPVTATGTPLLLYSPTAGATGNSTFRYDAKNQQFVFNWDTSSGVTAGCWEIVLQLADGSQARATMVPLR